MNIKKVRNYLMIAVVVFQIVLLTWESLNGGVVTHNFLAQKDMPGLSNWWGLAILPILVWLTAYNIEYRSEQIKDEQSRLAFYTVAARSFVGMLLISLAQSTIFSLGYSSIAASLLLVIALIALFLPLYRIEAVVGYVLGGAYFTGPMIPFVGVILFVTVSVTAHFAVKPLVMRFKNTQALNE
ncbi:hypothetical protein CWB73_19415 [Pseudoalteromonas phenolica]|uniref:Uncharacterized protein n=1 Tax=Pseudoalteromonas phenolica TaxID=161398 RepID=A0A5S3YN58_9GAMM|nr:hypothetical protein [Pseudoalteromonas phenolica]TMP77586.1 hypothetical protein CWB73_19415 [Pseudoalteromonas phenolica]